MSAPDPIALLLARATEGLDLSSAEEIEARHLEQARAEIARDARTFRASLEPSLPPERFGKLVTQPRLHALCERYELAHGSVLVQGPAGVGKTLTIKRLGRRLLAQAWRAGDSSAPIVGAVWISALELAEALRETRYGHSCEAMKGAQRAPVLFLDELGQERDDPRWLLPLLDFRYGPRHRPTLTTSGLTHDQLIERYGVGSVRRLTEPVGAQVNLFSGAR